MKKIEETILHETFSLCFHFAFAKGREQCFFAYPAVYFTSLPFLEGEQFFSSLKSD